MSLFKSIVLCIFVFFHLSVLAQRIGFQEVDDSQVSDWIVSSVENYEYVYHFGDSEMESDFLLIVKGNRAYAQIRSGYFGNSGRTWMYNYETLSNVRIEGNQFYSNKTNGEFVIYYDGLERIKGLKVFKPWSGVTPEGVYEIGTKSYPVEKYFAGKFPQASLRLIPVAELEEMSKKDLKIMRNEIFARYGYKFNQGGEMDTYFRQQSWYIAQNENVYDFFTQIEKENIKRIQRVEKQQK